MKLLSASSLTIKWTALFVCGLFLFASQQASSMCAPSISSLSCSSPVTLNITASGYTGSLPTSGDAGCNPCCYSGSDVDCDGLQDMSFSVENSKWYSYCNTTASTIVVNLVVDEPGTGSSCNLQGAVWVGASFSSSVIDCGNPSYNTFDSNPGGASDGFTFSAVSIPPGECAYVMIDGYGGATCTGVTASVICPCTPPTIGVTAGTNPICPGGSTTLTASGGSTYTWSPSTGLSATTGTSVTASPTSTTTYTVTGDDGTGCTSTATITVTVSTPPDPNAGSDVTICLGSSATIGADPVFGTEGATYSWNNGAGSGTIDLSGGGQDHGTKIVSPAATTTYTLTVTSGCTGTDAVVVTVINPANAGTNGTLTTCSTSASSNLFSSLGGTPQAGGTWTGPSALSGGSLGTYNPATNTAGTYTYTVTGTAPCPNATATVTVTENTAPSAGTNGSITLCSNGANVNLFSSLGGTPTAGGSWTGPSVLGGGSLGTFTPGTSSAGVYTYTVTGVAPCANASATVTVTVNAAPNAGTNGTLTTCSNSPSSNLFSSLGGTPQAGGTWSGPSALTGGSLGTYDPASNTAGVYTYTVTGTAPCANSSATVTVTENAGPDAGTDGAISFCPSDPAASLFNELGGSPDAGGVWSGPSALTGGDAGNFNPSTMSAGAYTYTVDGGICPDATAMVTTAVNGSFDATITAGGPFCQNLAPVTLTAGDPGGAWSGTGITDAVNGIFDPSVAGTGTFTITYTIPGGCGDTDTENFTVTASDNPSFSYSTSTFCTAGANPTPTITGLAGGTFAIDNGGMINAATGQINLAGSGAGSYTVTYTTTGGCPASATFDLIIGVSQDATITAGGPFCEDIAAFNLTAADAGGTWSGTGITDAVNGVFDPAIAGSGTWTITYTIAGACGDTDTEDFTVNALDDASFTYASGTYCTADTDPLPIITGTSGGTFAIDNGGTLNSATGQVDLSASGAGNFVITYSTGGPCPDMQSFAINITSNPDATITPVGPFCDKTPPVNLTAADPGGVWSGTGITDPGTGTFNPSATGPGSFIIDYTISGACSATDSETIVVLPTDDASFTYSSNNYCLTEPNPTPVITGLAGGTFTINNGGAIDAVTGQVDITASGAGNFMVTYTTNGPCPTSETFLVVISSAFDATISNPGIFCENDAVTILTAADLGGEWTGTGITDINAGTFDPSLAGPGTAVVYYTITGACGAIDSAYIDVLPVDDASFTYSQSSYCVSGSNPMPVITGLAGGTFTINNGGIIDALTGEVDLAASGTGSFSVTYTTNGNCPDSSTFDITITTTLDASINPAGPYCLPYVDVLSAATAGGTWTGTGVDPTTGVFNSGLAGAGTHQIIYTIPGACGSADTIFIIVNATPLLSITGDTIIAAGNSLNLSASGGTTYLWAPAATLSCTDCANPVATPTETTQYCVVTESNGCSDTSCVMVTVTSGCEVFVPEAFSPNNDSNNDLECVYGSCITAVSFSVYDRWGEKVFETTTIGECWDGTYRDQPMNTGVYAYILEYTLLSGEVFIEKGNISLFR
jgi:gliding motility-associated-like protein